MPQLPSRPSLRRLGGLAWVLPPPRDSLYYLGYYPPIMENQMEKNMENEMETGIIGFIGAVTVYIRGPIKGDI